MAKRTAKPKRKPSRSKGAIDQELREKLDDLQSRVEGLRELRNQCLGALCAGHRLLSECHELARHGDIGIAWRALEGAMEAMGNAVAACLASRGGAEHPDIERAVADRFQENLLSMDSTLHEMLRTKARHEMGFWLGIHRRLAEQENGHENL